MKVLVGLNVEGFMVISRIEAYFFFIRSKVFIRLKFGLDVGRIEG